MPYMIAVLCVLVAYTFPVLPLLPSAPFLVPAILASINLVIVLTLGKNWSRKDLLNCAVIIKYGTLPIYVIIVMASIKWYFKSHSSVLLSLLMSITVLVIGIVYYIFLLAASPYSIAYLVKACKEQQYPKRQAILMGVCQLVFPLDLLALVAILWKEKHLIKTTIVFLCGIAAMILIFSQLFNI